MTSDLRSHWEHPITLEGQQQQKEKNTTHNKKKK